MDDERAVALLPRMAAWHTELMDFGLIVVASEIDGVPTAEATALARTRGLTFPFTGRTRFGAPDGHPLPHTVVYDHQGKCVFRGPLADAEPYVRIAVGRGLLAKADLGTADKAAKPVVELLEQGAPIAQVLTKLADQLRLTAKDAAEQLVKLQTVLTAGGKVVLDAAAAKAKDDPVAAFFEAERLPGAYKGTLLEKPAADLLTTLRKDAKVGVELRARPYLEPMKKLDVQLSGRDRSFDPTRPRFKEENADLLKKLEDAIVRMRKAYPSARATDEANRLAERWDVAKK
jgi:hypothetical protein